MSERFVDLDEFIEYLPDNSQVIETKIIYDHEICALYDAVDQLDFKYREIIIYLAKGYKFKEISKLLDLPINTCLTRSKRAKELLFKILQKNEIKRALLEILI